MNSKLESDVRCRLQVTPSGESYEGERRPGSKYNGSLLRGLWRDSLHVTCGLTACTPGSAAGPTLDGNEYGKTLPFFTMRKPLVAMISSILSACFIGSTATASVRRPKGPDQSAWPPSKSATGLRKKLFTDVNVMPLGRLESGALNLGYHQGLF